MRVAPIRDKNVFGTRGLMLGKRMFAAVGTDSVLLKLLPSEYQSALEREGVRAFKPGDTALGHWVEVDATVVADDPELRDWLAAGLRALR